MRSSLGWRQAQAYVSVAATLLGFESHLPIVVIDTFGTSLRNDGNTGLDFFEPGFMAIFEPDAGGVTHLDLISQPSITSRIGIKIRGSSTDRGSRNKKSYRFEFRDEQGEDRSLSPLSLPRDSDWILYGSHDRDRGLSARHFPTL